MSIIVCKNISKAFKGKILFNNVSFEVLEGECLGIIGSNGSGKSVLFSMLAGLQDADEGEIFVRGNRVGTKYFHPSNLGITITQPAFIPVYSGLDNLMALAELNNKADKAQISQLMRDFGLDPNNKTIVKKYSAGMLQKLNIIQATMEDQDILLIDEPLAALDVDSAEYLIEYLAALKASGKTIVITSHQFNLLDELASRILCIYQQNIVPVTPEIRAKFARLS